MKQTRLLEIIREEIAGALKEGEAEERAAKAAEIKAIDLKQKALDAEKRDTMKSGALEEDTLNEEPDFGGQLDKKVAAKYGKEDTLEAATEKITNRVLSDKGITKADVAKMDKKELDSLLKDIRAFISQKKQTPEVAAALKKQIEFDDSGSKLQDNQTNKAILRVLGFGSKKGPKGPTKPKTEKPASTGKKGRPASEPKTEKTATLTKGDDGLDSVDSSDADNDKEATQNIGKDKTAKSLGKAADVSTNPDFNRILKGLQNKRKNSKEGVLSPENMKLAIDIINTAKDKYKFSPVEVEKLRAEINL